jgi:adenylosuccinate lyase
MILNELTAIGPVDGRYRRVTSGLAPFMSEWGLMRYRVKMEVEYLLALGAVLPALNDANLGAHSSALRNIYESFTDEDALTIKHTEKTTNHDVKAVEYFVKEKLDALGLGAVKEYVHFGLTSQDINNTAIPLSFKDANEAVLFPLLQTVTDKIAGLASDWEQIPMLARTHGQPASPTRLGKEFQVFVSRIRNQTAQLKAIPYSAKFGGATGNFNAHFIAYPNSDWHAFANQFLQSLGLHRSSPTTQIEHYDNLAAQCDAFKRINTILIDMCRDIWTYISMDYFKQKLKAGEIGSSAMPHKVNPIDFENAEGNLMLANAVFEFLSAKLPVSRLQRDLTDSTVLRNLGVPMAHTLIALNSIIKGLDKLLLNDAKIQQDLEDNWVVIAEAIQTVLRRENVEKPYELLKDLTRTHEKITRESIQHFIANLKVADHVKAELMNISPFNFVGK